MSTFDHRQGNFVVIGDDWNGGGTIPQHETNFAKTIRSLQNTQTARINYLHEHLIYLTDDKFNTELRII